jgi:prophage tail gpP-like protein
MKPGVVSLRVDGRTYRDWTDVSIAYGIETAARSFSFTATQPGAPADASPVAFYPGDAFDLSVDGERVITGYIDAIAPSYSATDSAIGVSGRSKTGQIVDCSVVGKKRFNDLRIEQIAAKLCAPYGVEVRTDLPPGDTTGEPVRRFVAEQGETVFEAIERAARLRSLLIFDDAEGRLVLRQGAPGSFPLAIGTELERGRNILNADASFDLSGVFNEYRIKSQTAGDDQDFGNAVTGIEALGIDGAAFGGKPRILVLSTDSGANRKRALARAQWEAAQRWGRSTSIEVRVRGWYDTEDQLYQPGTLVRLVDPFLRVDSDLLLVNVSLTLNNSEQVAALTLAPETGYYAELPSNPRKGIGGWRPIG